MGNVLRPFVRSTCPKPDRRRGLRSERVRSPRSPRSPTFWGSPPWRPCPAPATGVGGEPERLFVAEGQGDQLLIVADEDHPPGDGRVGPRRPARLRPGQLLVLFRIRGQEAQVAGRVVVQKQVAVPEP